MALGAASWLFAQGGPEEIRLTVGKSIVIDYPADIARISTSNPDIVDASPVTGREVLVHGKSFGTVTLVVWSKAGQRNFYNITVEQNLEPLRQLLKETFPAQDIHVQSSRDSLSLTGRVANKDIGDRATALATPFAKTVVNNLQVAEPPVERQILLRIKFAELDRSAANQFAVNLISTGATNTIGAHHAPASSRPPAPSEYWSGGIQLHLHHFQRAEHFRLPAGLEPGGVHPSPGTTKPAADLGRADPDDQRWQRSQLPGGRRISHPGPAGRSEFRRRHHSVSRIRRAADLHADHHRQQQHSLARQAGSFRARLQQRAVVQRIHHSRRCRRAKWRPMSSWAKARALSLPVSSTTR